MGFMDPPLRGPCNFASFTTFFLLLSVGYPNSKNRYCQIIWSTQSRHCNEHRVTNRLQGLRLMRKSIFTSLWTLAFIQAKDHQSQIDQISEDFQTEFSYRGRMIIPARRPLSGSVTPSWYQTGGPTNLPSTIAMQEFQLWQSSPPMQVTKCLWRGRSVHPCAPFTDKIFQVLFDDHPRNVMFLFCLYSSYLSN